MRKKIKSQTGMAMIEFALVSPLVFLILIGLLEFGLLLYNQNIISDASRQGARYGTMQNSSTGYPSSSAVVTYTTNYISSRLISFSGSTPSATVTATPSITIPTLGANLTVTVQFTYTDLILHNFVSTGNTHNLSSTTTMPYN